MPWLIAKIAFGLELSARVQGGFHIVADVPHSCRPPPRRMGIGDVPMHLGLLAGDQLLLEWQWGPIRKGPPLVGILDPGTRIGSWGAVPCGLR